MDKEVAWTNLYEAVRDGTITAYELMVEAEALVDEFSVCRPGEVA